MSQPKATQRSLAATAFVVAAYLGAEGVKTIWHVTPDASDHDHSSVAVRIIVVAGLAVCFFAIYLGCEAIRLWSESSAHRIRRICMALAIAVYLQLNTPGFSEGANTSIRYIAAGALYWITCPRLIKRSGETEPLQTDRGIKVFCLFLLFHLLPNNPSAVFGEPREWTISRPVALALLAVFLLCFAASYKLMTHWMIRWRSKGSSVVPALCTAIVMSGIIVIGHRSVAYVTPCGSQ